MSSDGKLVGLFRNKGLVSLDALRAVAALSVAIPHYFLFQGQAGPTLEFISIMAVEVFFALSGFVLARQLIFCVESSSWRNLSVFYARRWMRTLPPYLIVLTFLSVTTHQLFSSDFWQYVFFVRNLGAIHGSNDYFTVAWSLAVEEWFYLVFPLFLILLVRAKFTILAAALTFIGVLFAIKIAYLIAVPDLFDHARRIVVLRLDSIAFGFLLAIVSPHLMQHRARALSPLLVTCLVALALGVLATSQGFVFLFIYAAPIFAVTLIGLLLLAEDLFQRSAMVAKLASFGANTSYMIYLLHTLLIIKLTDLHGAVPPAMHFFTYLFLLIGICALFFLAVEAPILRARPRYRMGSAAQSLKPSSANAVSDITTGRLRISVIVLSNALAIVIFSVAIEGGAWAVKQFYVNVRNSYGSVMGVAPIEQKAKIADASDQAGTYSSAAVARDIALNDAMPGSAYHYESYVVYQNRPFASEMVNVAENGMRTNGSTYTFGDHRQRVWIFGSSPIFGMTSADNETIPSNVEVSLRRLLGKDVAVANFGVPGYTSWQDLLHFQLRLAELPKPDLVIFFNGHNDHNLAWLAQSKSCETLLGTGVGSSRVLSESWDLRAHGGVVIWQALLGKLRSVFSNTFELVRLVEKFVALKRANNDISGWRQQYRVRRDKSAAIAEGCVPREQASYLRNMRLAAELALGEGILVVFIHQPVLYTTKKPLVGVERQEANHLNDAFFALNDQALETIEAVPPHRIDQDQLWVKQRYDATYENQKAGLRDLARRLDVRFIDLDPVIDEAGPVAIFSSSIHFTFRGTQLLGEKIANDVVDLLKTSKQAP